MCEFWTKTFQKKEMCYNKQGVYAIIEREMEKIMKKKMFALLISACAVMALTGCGNKEISNEKITIKQYKGLEVEKVEVEEVTDEDVELSIQSTLETLATSTEITDRAVQTGDVVTIDYVGKVDGVAFKGGTAEGESIEIGNSGYIDGFDDGIIGHTVGEVFDINVTFPEDYSLSEELAGADAVFTITLNKIEEVTVPELTEDIVAQIVGSEMTVEEYKAQVREDLEASNQESADYNLEGYVWQALLDQCEVAEYPEDELEEMKTSITDQYSTYAYYYGMEIEDFVEQYYGISVEEMAKQLIAQDYAIELIVEKEKITVTAAEYEEGLASYAEQYGYDDPEEFEEVIGEDSIREVLLQKKVIEFLVDNCKQVE